MRIPLVAAGMRADLYDPSAAAGTGLWNTVTRKTKNKKAGAPQAGLSTTIAKAGKATPQKRGQCDYYGANLQCPRGQACEFTCYNGPGSR